MAGSHYFIFDKLSDNDWIDLNSIGIRIFSFCTSVDSLIDNKHSALRMLFGGFKEIDSPAYIGTHIPESLE